MSRFSARNWIVASAAVPCPGGSMQAANDCHQRARCPLGVEGSVVRRRDDDLVRALVSVLEHQDGLDGTACQGLLFLSGEQHLAASDEFWQKRADRLLKLAHP